MRGRDPPSSPIWVPPNWAETAAGAHIGQMGTRMPGKAAKQGMHCPTHLIPHLHLF
jgi:hypothetical protein